MVNYLADSNSVAYSGVLASAKETTLARVIETEMLDGSFTVQTIGDPSVRVNIEYYGSIADRRLLEAAAAAAEMLEVYWKDRVYTGIISGGQVTHEPWNRSVVTRAEKVAFTLLAIEVAVR